MWRAQLPLGRGSAGAEPSSAPGSIRRIRGQKMTLSASSLWLIPVLPLIAAGIGALTPKSGRTFAAGAAIATMAASFVLACLALGGALADPTAHQAANFSWFD